MATANPVPHPAAGAVLAAAASAFASPRCPGLVRRDPDRVAAALPGPCALPADGLAALLRRLWTTRPHPSSHPDPRAPVLDRPSADPGDREAA